MYNAYTPEPWSGSLFGVRNGAVERTTTRCNSQETAVNGSARGAAARLGCRLVVMWCCGVAVLRCCGAARLRCCQAAVLFCCLNARAASTSAKHALPTTEARRRKKANESVDPDESAALSGGVAAGDELARPDQESSLRKKETNKDKRQKRRERRKTKKDRTTRDRNNKSEDQCQR